MLEIYEHIRTNGMAYLVGALFVLPLLFLFRAKTIPLVYHTIEYCIYCTTFHYLVGGILRLGWWYRSETAFKNADGSMVEGVVPYETPLTMHFWEKELYNPEWVFYFETVAIFAILYVVVVVRPMRFKRNVHKGRIEQPLKDRKSKKANATAPDMSQRKMAARRDRLQKIRGTR